MKLSTAILITVLYCLTIVGSRAQESPIVLHTKTGDVKGTLSLPSKTKNIPVVLIISGSGPTDRNCNSALGLKSDAFKHLADDLRKKGIASVRFDKRGVGESTLTGVKQEDVRFEHFVQDVKEWIDMLSVDKRFSKVIVAGHSEGSLIGIIATSNNPKVHGLISIAGPGDNACTVLKEQLSVLPEEISKQANLKLDSLKLGSMVANNISGLEMLFNPAVQPYLISWFKYNPQEEIKPINIPTLIIVGDKDIQVSVANADQLAAANPSVKKVIIKNMNHVLKDCNTSDRMANMESYGKPELPLNKEFVKEMVMFIKSID